MDNNFVEILNRLDQIFKLIAVTATKELKQRDRIALLDNVGLTPKQIAELLGTSSNTVRVELVTIRRDKNKRKK